GDLLLGRLRRSRSRSPTAPRALSGGSGRILLFFFLFRLLERNEVIPRVFGYLGLGGRRVFSCRLAQLATVVCGFVFCALLLLFLGGREPEEVFFVLICVLNWRCFDFFWWWQL